MAKTVDLGKDSVGLMVKDSDIVQKCSHGSLTLLHFNLRLQTYTPLSHIVTATRENTLDAQ